jgi:predicted nucleic acid-binding protein
VAVPEGAWILDTSVVVPWFFEDEPLRERALEVRRDLCRAPDRYLVPALFHSELVHVLARKSGRDEAFAGKALGLVLALGVRTLALPESAFARMAHWTCRGLSGYDATFVTLAESLGGRWLTADRDAARIAGGALAETLRSWRSA